MSTHLLLSSCFQQLPQPDSGTNTPSYIAVLYPGLSAMAGVFYTSQPAPAHPTPAHSPPNLHIPEST